ncbi:hypothetical protein D6C91_06545 [Aureobasidium pullulans]|uniref:Uncharacterized protein n=1 Tax=Aureobasidium pullulans TaxID=5580 RepID=A0A4S9SYW1_AURPU|nr:hypothetical protein D6C91_06545 [Aureobasidium pullulans]
MSSVSLALPNELMGCLTIEIDCTHSLEEEDYHEDMAMFAETLHNIKNLADRNERLNTISISLKYIQLTTQRGHKDHPFQMLALQKFAHQFMLPKVAEAGLVLDTFYLELNFDAAPTNAALMRWVVNICAEDSPITSDVGIGYYRVIPNKEHEAWVHFYRTVSFVHCFPSCIASSQRLCPSGKHFTAPSSSRSTFITWGRSAGTFIVASLAHLSPLAPSPNQHIQCSASTSQTIQTTSPMHNTLLGPSSAPGFHKPPPESPTALIGPIAGLALFPLSRLSFRQHQHIVFASSFFGTSISLLLIDMLQRPSNSSLIDNGTSFPSRLPSTTPSVRHRLTSF